MNQTKNIKGNCQRCGGVFDFPVEGIGQTVDCPHCSKPTELQLAMPPATSAVSARQIVYVIVAITILIGGLAGAMIALKRAQRMSSNQIGAVDVAGATTTTTTATTDPLAQAGFQASAVTIEKATSGSLLYAKGTLKNISSTKKFGVKIELELRDEQNWKLGTTTDYQPTLEPAAEWKFRAMVMNPKTASAAILSIKEDQ